MSPFTSSLPTRRPNPPRGRRRKSSGHRSPAALAARRANLEKARAAPKEVIYRRTKRRRAASRANIQKAIAWRRSPEGNAVARLNALKHGAVARTLEESVKRLRENPAEFRRHRELFQRVYVPQDDKELLLIQRLAETTWRRLRLFHAQARWETERLHALFAVAPPTDRLTPAETQQRAWGLVHILNSWDPLFREAAKLESRVERLLRVLLWRRSGGAIKFKLLSPKRDAFFTETREFSVTDVVERLQYFTPRRRAQIFARLKDRVAAKHRRERSGPSRAQT